MNSVSDSLGATLRSAREARGLSLHKAAQGMHVSDDIIEALERDDFASLGAPIFVRGHLRNYARLLGLPEDEILAAEHTADKLVPPQLIPLQPGGGHAFGRRFAMPVFSVIVIALLLVLSVVWWQHRPVEPSAMALAVRDMGTAQKSVVAAPATSSNQPPLSESGDVSRIEIPAEKSKEPPQHALASAPIVRIKLNPVTKPAAIPAERANHGQISSTTTANVPALQPTLAKFTLTQPSWVEVYDASGKRLYYGLARAGDTLNVSGAGPLQVFLGNAPGVSIEMNGVPFNLAPFTHPDNTARFRLGEIAGNSGPAD
ncbi:MAG TPA: RodZ domain-containing protein [Gammaproteobacteria bacterium]|nr:RodZ domain-containing protein [Gammaproteobacteria bacterium]